MTELPASTEPTSLPRPGVPVWRVGKPDTFLAEATATALAAVQSIATDENIGKHIGVRSEGIRCATHLFECLLPGYVGWQWFATLTRVSRSKDATVNEVGMLPTEDSILAPPWVPWAERVRPEDAAEMADPADSVLPELASTENEDSPASGENASVDYGHEGRHDEDDDADSAAE